VVGAACGAGGELHAATSPLAAPDANRRPPSLRSCRLVELAPESSFIGPSVEPRSN
jgi:hypothetical protein